MTMDCRHKNFSAKNNFPSLGVSAIFYADSRPAAVRQMGTGDGPVGKVNQYLPAHRGDNYWDVLRYMRLPLHLLSQSPREACATPICPHQAGKGLLAYPLYNLTF